MSKKKKRVEKPVSERTKETVSEGYIQTANVEYVDVIISASVLQNVALGLILSYSL